MRGVAKRWAIAITVPDGFGWLKQRFLKDREGVMIFMSQVKAKDYMKSAYHQRMGPNAKPRVIRVQVSVESIYE